MSREEDVAAVRQRHEDGERTFTRGEVATLLAEITHLTLVLADLHAGHRQTFNPDGSDPGAICPDCGAMIPFLERSDVTCRNCGFHGALRSDGKWQTLLPLKDLPDKPR